LLEGELFFNEKTHQLIEARLNGSASVKDGSTDSLSLLIHYKTDTLFVLPAYVKMKIRMNFLGYPYRYVQEYTFVNHSVNDPSSKPYIDINRLVSAEPNLTYDVDLKREAMFRTPGSGHPRFRKGAPAQTDCTFPDLRFIAAGL
jgi:hypothetical protein